MVKRAGFAGRFSQHQVGLAARKCSYTCTSDVAHVFGAVRVHSAYYVCLAEDSYGASFALYKRVRGLVMDCLEYLMAMISIIFAGTTKTIDPSISYNTSIFTNSTRRVDSRLNLHVSSIWLLR